MPSHLLCNDITSFCNSLTCNRLDVTTMVEYYSLHYFLIPLQTRTSKSRQLPHYSKSTKSSIQQHLPYRPPIIIPSKNSHDSTVFLESIPPPIPLQEPMDAFTFKWMTFIPSSTIIVFIKNSNSLQISIYFSYPITTHSDFQISAKSALLKIH